MRILITNIIVLFLLQGCTFVRSDMIVSTNFFNNFQLKRHTKVYLENNKVATKSDSIVLNVLYKKLIGADFEIVENKNAADYVLRMNYKDSTHIIHDTWTNMPYFLTNTVFEKPQFGKGMIHISDKGEPVSYLSFYIHGSESANSVGSAYVYVYRHRGKIIKFPNETVEILLSHVFESIDTTKVLSH